MTILLLSTIDPHYILNISLNPLSSWLISSQKRNSALASSALRLSRCSGASEPWYVVVSWGLGWCSAVRPEILCGFMDVYGPKINWLVVSIPLKNMSSSVGMIKFPIYWKIKIMFQTTNQSTYYEENLLCVPCLLRPDTTWSASSPSALFSPAKDAEFRLPLRPQHMPWHPSLNQFTDLDDGQNSRETQELW